MALPGAAVAEDAMGEAAVCLGGIPRPQEQSVKAFPLLYPRWLLIWFSRVERFPHQHVMVVDCIARPRFRRRCDV